MGVPKFYRWLSERYPLINQQCNSVIRPEFDCLYLDMNGILHNASFSDDDHLRVRISEEQIFSNVFKYVDRLFQLARPKRLLFMAIDGVAPRAKMNQQRQRRFRSAQDRSKEIDEARKRGELNVEDTPFDSNQITPGTEFMKKVSDHLKFFIRKKIKEDAGWRGIKVILSGAEVPGEGEHKIMMYIRNMKMQPGYDPNLRHCLYGLDADLIFLSLVSHEPHFALLREEVVFGSGKQGSLPRKQLKKIDEFQYLHVSVLREYIDAEFAILRDGFTWGYNLERVIDDWVILSFLVGNDFLAHLPTLDIGEGGLDTLIGIYKSSLSELGGYLIEGGKLNPSRLEVILKKMGELEEAVFQERLDKAAAEEKKERRRNRRNNEIGTDERFDGEDEVDQKNSDTFAVDEKKSVPQALPVRNDKVEVAEKEKENSDEADAEMIFPSPSPQQSPSPGDSSPFPLPVDVPIEELTGAAIKARYYRDKFPEFYDLNEMQRRSPELIVADCPKDADGWIRSLTSNYLEGLHWILAYYYNGVPSWKWYFKFRYAPLASDMKNLASIPVGFTLGLPFRPLEQLLGTLPPASRGFLPAPYRELMSSESPIVDFYPTDFLVDMNGKRNAWEGIALIPFIDEVRLLGAVNKIDKLRLSQLERLRNVRFGDEYQYEYDEKVKDTYPSTMNQFGPIVECQSRCTVWKLPAIPTDESEENAEEKNVSSSRFSSTAAFIDLSTRNFDDDKEDKEGFSTFAALSSGRFKPELCKNVTFPLPGFPHLRAMEATAHLDAIGVNVFGMESRKQSLVLQLQQSASPLSLQAIASAYVGKRGFVDWPFLRECIITSISDSKCRITVTGREDLKPTDSDNFGRDAAHMKVKYLSTKAVDCGSVAFIATVRPFDSMKRMGDGSIQKYFSESEVAIPFQLIVVSSSVAEKDNRFVEIAPPTLQSTFPIGMQVVYIGPKHYGSMATIVSHNSTQPGKQSVSLQLTVLPSEPDFGHLIANSSRLQFYPSYMVAKAIDVHPGTLGKITGSVFLVGYRDIDLGLKLRFSKQGMAVPEYARRVDSWKGSSAPNVKSSEYSSSQDNAGSWEYSEKAIALLLAYKKRFPKFFEVVNSNPSVFKFNPTDFVVVNDKTRDSEPTRQQGLAAVNEIVEWLKTVGITNLILVPCTSQVMADRGVKAIEVESARVREALIKKSQTMKIDSVPIFHLYAPSPPVPWSPTEGESPDLGDRIVTIRSDTGVPLGLRGTVVALHGKHCEVVFDEEFMGGNTLNNRCSNLRGHTIPFTSFVNVTKPKVLVPIAVKKAKIESAQEVKTKVAAERQPNNNIIGSNKVKEVKEEVKEHKEHKPKAPHAPSAPSVPSVAVPPADVAAQLKSMLGVGGASPSAAPPTAIPAFAAPSVPSLIPTIGVQPGEDDSDVDAMARLIAEKKAKKALAGTGAVPPNGRVPPQFGAPMPMLGAPGMPPVVYPDMMGMAPPMHMGAVSPPFPHPADPNYMFPPPGVHAPPMFMNAPPPMFFPPPPNAGFIPPPHFMNAPHPYAVMPPQGNIADVMSSPPSTPSESAFDNVAPKSAVEAAKKGGATTGTKHHSHKPESAHSAFSAVSSSPSHSAPSKPPKTASSAKKGEWKPKEGKDKVEASP